MANFAKKASGIASRSYNPEAELKGIYQDTSGLAASIERALDEVYAQGWHGGWNGGIKHYIASMPKHFYQEPWFRGIALVIMLIGVPLLLIGLLPHHHR